MLVQIKYCYQYVVKSVGFGVGFLFFLFFIFFSCFFSTFNFFGVTQLCKQSVLVKGVKVHCRSVSYQNKRIN